MKTRDELVEEVWAASNLTWRQAAHIIDEAIELGIATSHWMRLASPTPFSKDRTENERAA